MAAEPTQGFGLAPDLDLVPKTEQGKLDAVVPYLQVVQLWRKELSKINAKAAESLADPAQYSNLFPDLDLALKAEQHQRQQRKDTVPAKDFQDYEGGTMANLIEEIRGEWCWQPLVKVGVIVSCITQTLNSVCKGLPRHLRTALGPTWLRRFWVSDT